MKCSIVSGSPNDDVIFINENIDKNSFIIAADSGYLKLNNIKPNLIVGDFDSSIKPNIETEIITLPSVKDETDTMTSVKIAIERGYDEIIIFGGIGSRFDHTYSNVLSLDYAFNKGIKARLVNKNNSIEIINKEITFKKEYNYFSVFSLSDNTVISISGAKYPLNNYHMTVCDNLGQSNEVVDEFATVKIIDGKAIIVFSND